ncbi:hypothetical protein HK100_004575 [Physocladia obscura]|uniref:L domain-like protein n=1 Tax=Physocladia obscura TaxID=109957 RepID=A0AAD5SUW0_9FUNG|nr:hypothetical protein HK100_004575 [Physocladia obscura]
MNSLEQLPVEIVQRIFATLNPTQEQTDRFFTLSRRICATLRDAAFARMVLQLHCATFAHTQPPSAIHSRKHLDEKNPPTSWDLFWFRAPDPLPDVYASSVWPQLSHIDFYSEDLIDGAARPPHMSQILHGRIPPAIAHMRANLSFLALAHNNLKGPIPREIGLLVHLKDLYLNNNYLSDAIPPEIGQLSRLKFLDLSHNRLQHSIPEELGSLDNLHSLDLSHNELTGEIPRKLCNLHSFRKQDADKLSFGVSLNLGHNRLVGSIPDEIGNLILIRKLRLDHNQLSGCIPLSISKLEFMWQLLLNNNRISGEISQICSLQRLAHLDLSVNLLTGAIPIEFARLRNLSTFLLTDNPMLDMDLPAKLCDGTASLFLINLTESSRLKSEAISPILFKKLLDQGFRKPIK